MNINIEENCTSSLDAYMSLSSFFYKRLSSNINIKISQGVEELSVWCLLTSKTALWTMP